MLQEELNEGGFAAEHTPPLFYTSRLPESQLNTEVKDIRGFFPQSSRWFALQLKVQLSEWEIEK